MTAALAEYPTVRRVVGPTIPLRSGAYFDFLDPESCPFTIEDVAWGLSNIARFTGQSHRFYSVGQHSLHMSWVVPEEHAFAALMHDAPEFVLGDMSKPLKLLCPDYCALEKKIEPVILARFGLSFPLDPVIKDADVRMLATEQQQLWGERVKADNWLTTVQGKEPWPICLPKWPKSKVFARFLRRFDELGGRERMKETSHV